MEKLLVIKKPIFSEKSLKEAELGKYTFEVSKDANKRQIARAVEREYKVNVLSVRTIVSKGKRTRVRGTNRKKPSKIIKKAIIQLQKDQKIPAFQGK